MGTHILAAIVVADRLLGRDCVVPQGMIAGTKTAAFAGLMKEDEKVLTPIVHGGEQSNTSAMFDDKFILKLFRRITPGVNPDLEIGRELTEHSELSIVPKVAGAIEYRADSGKPIHARRIA